MILALLLLQVCGLLFATHGTVGFLILSSRETAPENIVPRLFETEQFLILRLG
jgi:hypothetical protein